MRRLPPLNWLRSFEVAARHLSFTRAAEELHVTQAAISQQVKSLEAHLETPLFKRARQRLFLTESGQTLAPRLREGFDAMAQGVQEMESLSDEGTLTLRVSSSFAPQWLVPRLGRFYARHPDIDLRFTTVDKAVDFTRDDVDAEIRFGAGHWSDVETHLIIHDRIFPVCAPALMDGPPPLDTPSDLSRHRLLHVTGTSEWKAWGRAVDMPWLPGRRAHVFDHAVLALQAAINGIGVALGRTSLVQTELESGRLVVPFDFALDTPDGYWLLCPRGHAERPDMVALRGWLLDEAEATPHIV
ncbi:MAG: transcriptional regulator GcvA [Chromatiales bacterium]|jgi:LysR family transcriptional regulator, glycine cleavage system transcriptional activator|nr:transcriptional regulator GcvA [Chromatiales bacterium]